MPVRTMIVIDSMMNRSIRFVSVMNAGAARLRFRFPLVAITIGSRDGPCGFTIVIRCCNVVRASRQMSRVAMKAYSRPLYIYTRIYIFLSRIGDDHTRYEIFPSSFRLGEKSQHRVLRRCILRRVGKIVGREIRVDFYVS